MTKKIASGHKLRNDQAGFTIIELLIATVVFAVVLLVFLSAFLRVSQLFYKGVNLSNTQEAARTIVQTVSNDIQFYRNPPTTFPAKRYFCIGNHRYTYNLFKQYIPGKPGNEYGLLLENLSGCPSLTDKPQNLTNGRELLGAGMQLNKMDVVCAPTTSSCTVTVRVVFYGDDPTVLKLAADDANAVCTGPSQSTQYCATAEYKSTVILQGTRT